MPDVKEIQTIFEKTGMGPVSPASVGGFRSSEQGTRLTNERRISMMYQEMMPANDLRSVILELRLMDKRDGRVKKIHNRMARDIVRGGLQLTMPRENRVISKMWRRYQRRLQLGNPQKLKSDARGMLMEGNLPMQWVLDHERRSVVAAVRMPTETIRPRVNETGRFKDPNVAYEQVDAYTGNKVLAQFPLWQLTLGRLDPQNFDDLGAFGRPYLDASREVWRKLGMTESDLVIRRRERAPLRTSHVLEGATEPELTSYKEAVESDQKEITTNYYMNKKGAVTALQGDANLDQIGDVKYLLDTFFAGSPGPAGIFGYPEGLNRDILEDLLRDYYQEVDNAQDSLAWTYKVGFELELLLNGIDPERYDYEIKFAERRTETPNQAADRALKYSALGASRATVLETAGLDPAKEKTRREDEDDDDDPYPQGGGSVKITPGNARKGESGTSIGNK